MVSVDGLLCAGPGFDLIPAMSSRAAVKTFFHDRLDDGLKKYQHLFCLKHNNTSAVSNKPALGRVVQHANDPICSLAVIRPIHPGSPSPPQKWSSMGLVTLIHDCKLFPTQKPSADR